MTPERWAQVRELFEAALTAPAAGRGEWLDQACAGNRELRREIDSLLAAHEGADRFIESPAYEAAAHLLADEPADGMAGQTLGPYLVRHEIGRGGMGVVYLADDTRLARRVALKAIGSGRGSDAGQRERLRREARAAAALSHAGIATVYALEDIGDQLYLVSEYVPGQTLRDVVARGPLPLAEVVDIATQLARALAVAHASGIVHRDIKPENVVRSANGVVKILDFGIARVEGASDPRLTGEAPVGTPSYMAPEQIRHDVIDFRTDLFALGLLVYELASGGNPFAAPTPTASIARVLEAEPPPLALVSPGSAALDRIVATCLRKHPGERYPSTQALVRDLERLQAQLAHETSAAGSLAFPALPASAVSSAGGSTRWWEVHQVVVSIVYALMIYPAWRARVWLPAPWQGPFFLAVVAAAVVTVAVRLHLVFAAHSYPDELSAQRSRARPWTRAGDVLFAGSLLTAALAINAEHSEVAALLLTVAAAATVSMLVIEPATARAAFSDQRSRS